MNHQTQNDFEVPFQVQQLLTALKDKNERAYIRGNYRMRLDNIRKTIDKAIVDYDVEMGTSDNNRRRSNGR